MNTAKRRVSDNAAHRVVTTDAAIDAAIISARNVDMRRPRAIDARYVRSRDGIAVALSNGVQVMIPRALIQGLQEATVEQLLVIEIEKRGFGLHWPALDVDHYVPALLAGVFGTRQWMADLGRKGGKVTNPAKASASRANGRRGGRPRKDSSRNVG